MLVFCIYVILCHIRLLWLLVLMSTWCVVKIVHIHVTFFVMYVMHFS